MCDSEVKWYRKISVLHRLIVGLRCCENCDCSDIHIENKVKTIECFYPSKLGICENLNKWRIKTPPLRINYEVRTIRW